MGEYTSLLNSNSCSAPYAFVQKTALAVLSESYEVNKLALYYSRTVVLNNQRRYCNEITVMQLSERIFSEVTTSERKFTINILKMDTLTCLTDVRFHVPEYTAEDSFNSLYKKTLK